MKRQVSINDRQVDLRNYQAPVWDEPVIMTMGREGRRGITFGQAEEGVREAVGAAQEYVPGALQRTDPPKLPELSQYEVLRHYLHLSQETLGMMGISFFGTCTMKYNPRVHEGIIRDYIENLHPYQDEETLQGILEIIYRTDLMLRALSGMDQFVFQAGGGADASYTHACVLRGYLAAKGELPQRDEIITTMLTHPCNPATAASAGFKIVNLMPERHAYPSLDSLKAAVSERTAGLMVVNPDDTGNYNPEIDKWIDVVHDAGGLCFYDHANFNGVMGLTRARDVGFDACMFMLHKTFGSPKGGAGAAAGAYGCSSQLAPFVPKPVVVRDGDGFRLDYDRPLSVGKVREFFGNVHVIARAYGWLMSMGQDGIDEARDLSVLHNNYLEKMLLTVPGVTRSYDDDKWHRLEMTRMSLADLQEETGVGTVDVMHRMSDYGIDPFWMSHHPWLVPEPFTPEVGETWPVEDIDYWAAALKQAVEEARWNPELVRSAPHNQPVHRIDSEAINSVDNVATTWRAYQRHQERSNGVSDPGVKVDADTAEVNAE